MKQCSVCKEFKAFEDFSSKNKAQGTLHSHCRKCQKVKSQNWYESNKSKHLINVVKNKKLYKNRNKMFLFDYLKTHPCVDCGEADLVVLEFDHRDPLTKLEGLSKLANGCCSLENLIEEVKKCDVRCANCHRRRTAKQFNWLKDIQ